MTTCEVNMHISDKGFFSALFVCPYLRNHMYNMLLRTLYNLQWFLVLILKFDLLTSFWALAVFATFYFTLQGNFASDEFNVNC